MDCQIWNSLISGLSISSEWLASLAGTCYPTLQQSPSLCSRFVQRSRFSTGNSTRSDQQTCLFLEFHMMTGTITWSGSFPPNGDQGLKIGCAGQYVAVLGESGTVYIWRSGNFCDTCTLRHHEAVTAMCFNKGGSKLITYGLRTSKLWSIPSGQLVSCTSNPVGSKAMTITFAENDKKVLIGSDDWVIRYLHVDDFDAGWQVLDPNLLRETAQIEGAFVNSPICVAFNGDATQVGVSYRGFPLSVWALNEARCIGRCRRVKGPRTDGVNPSTGWFGVDRFT